MYVEVTTRPISPSPQSPRPITRIGPVLMPARATPPRIVTQAYRSSERATLTFPH